MAKSNELVAMVVKAWRSTGRSGDGNYRRDVRLSELASALGVHRTEVYQVNKELGFQHGNGWDEDYNATPVLTAGDNLWRRIRWMRTEA